jgi:hypothetical protein
MEHQEEPANSANVVQLVNLLDRVLLGLGSVSEGSQFHDLLCSLLGQGSLPLLRSWTYDHARIAAWDQVKRATSLLFGQQDQAPGPGPAQPSQAEAGKPKSLPQPVRHACQVLRTYVNSISSSEVKLRRMPRARIVARVGKDYQGLALPPALAFLRGVVSPLFFYNCDCQIELR